MLNFQMDLRFGDSYPRLALFHHPSRAKEVTETVTYRPLFHKHESGNKRATFSAMIRSPTQRAGYMDEDGMNRISTNIKNDQTNAITRNLLSASRLGPQRDDEDDRLRDEKSDSTNSWQVLQHRERKWNKADGFRKLMAGGIGRTGIDQASKGLKRTVKMRIRRRR